MRFSTSCSIGSLLCKTPARKAAAGVAAVVRSMQGAASLGRLAAGSPAPWSTVDVGQGMLFDPRRQVNHGVVSGVFPKCCGADRVASGRFDSLPVSFVWAGGWVPFLPDITAGGRRRGRIYGMMPGFLHQSVGVIHAHHAAGKPWVR